jgi:hypothetical protein
VSLSKSAIVKTDGNVFGKIRTDLEDLAFLKLLGGGTAPLSPFQRSSSHRADSLPPLLGQAKKPRPATKGTYPLGSPNSVPSQRCCPSREAIQPVEMFEQKRIKGKC